MAERHRSLVVLLEDDMEPEAAQGVVALVEMIKGVDSVGLGPEVDGRDVLNREVAKREIRAELAAVLERHPNFRREGQR